MADNLVLGRGKLSFSPYAIGTTTGGVRGYFGNTPTFSMALTNTKLDHYSSEGGLKIKDRSVILQTDMALTFDTDNINLGNLVLWFGGQATGVAPADAPTGMGTVAVIGKASQIFGALTFESDNPVGDNLNYWFPYVSLAPAGNYALKGDAWQTLSFAAEALKRDPLTERMYVYTPASPAGNAAADTTALFTAASAAVGTSVPAPPATGGTITAPGTATVGTPFTANYTLTGGTTGFTALFAGATMEGTAKAISGASGTVSFTATATGAHTVKLVTDASGATTLATSATVTVS